MLRYLTRHLPFLTSVCAGSAFAHGGHGHTGPDEAAHYVVEPVHGVLWIGAALGALMLVRMGYARFRASPRRNARR